jgi:Xaa-Pro aminopeptidase
MIGNVLNKILFFLPLIAAFAFLGISVNGQTEQQARVAEIQKALRREKLDGWLFYDFRGSDPLAPRVLKLKTQGITTRRWYYYVPAQGEPTKLVHAIEMGKLDSLPGKKLIYREWELQHKYLQEILYEGHRPKFTKGGPLPPTAPRIAMQYSANNNIPYISRVDAGTIELIRSFRVNIVSSGDLIQEFEAVWDDEQLAMHKEAIVKVQKIITESFAEIKRRVNAGIPTTEYDIQQFMTRRYAEEGLHSDGDDPNVSVQANSADPHYQPTKDMNSPIKRGDLVLFDVWAKLKKPRSTYADLTWMGYVGETVPQEYVKVWNIVREARDAAYNYVRSAVRDKKGVTGAMVDDVSRGVIKKSGYADAFWHRTGHSIGEEVHGNGAHIDNLETKDTRRIMARTCFSIEPGIYLKGKFGVRSEIDVFVTESDVISAAPIQTEIIPILK